MRHRRSQPARAAVRHLATRPPLRRLFWAVARLRSGRPLKARDLAEEFEVNVRTAYRDRSYTLTEPPASLPAVPLSQGELVALYFAEKVQAQCRGTPFEPDLVSAFRKTQELLPEDVRVSPATLRPPQGT